MHEMIKQRIIYPPFDTASILFKSYFHNIILDVDLNNARISERYF